MTPTKEDRATAWRIAVMTLTGIATEARRPGVQHNTWSCQCDPCALLRKVERITQCGPV